MARVRPGSHAAGLRPRAFPGTMAAASATATPPAAARATPGDRRDQVTDLRRGSTLNLAAAAVSAVATTGVTVLVTREFSRPVAGAFFTSISAFLIVGAVAGLGTNVGLTYFIARLRALGNESKIPALMRTAVLPVIAASVSSAVLLVLVADPLARLLLSGHAQHAGVTPGAVAGALRGLAVMLPFAGLLNAHLGASRGYGDMRPTAVVGQMGMPVGRLLGVLLAGALGSAALLAPLWAISYLPAAILAWIWGRRIRRARRGVPVTLPDVPPELAALLALATPMPPMRRPVPGPPGQAGQRTAHRRLASVKVRGFWSFTTPRAIANVAQNILQQIDIVLVASMRGPAEAAVYTAATRFLVIGQLGAVAISRASQARFTELFTHGDHRGANNIYQVTTTWLVLLLWPLFLLTVAYGPVVLSVFGRAYGAGYLVMVILGLSMLLATACGQVDMVLITSGRSGWSLANGLLTVGVNVAVDLALIPRYGITGAAIGWAAAIAVGNLVPLAQLAVVLRLHPFGRGTILACALSGLSFGVIPLALRGVLGGGIVSLSVAVIAGTAVYAAGLWRLRRVLRLPPLPGRRRASRIPRTEVER